MSCAVKQHIHEQKYLLHHRSYRGDHRRAEGARDLLGIHIPGELDIDCFPDQPPDLTQMFFGRQDVTKTEAHHHPAA